MTHAFLAPAPFSANRRAVLGAGLVMAAMAALPGLASADPFMVDIAQTNPAQTPRQGDVLDTAAASGQFTTFLRAVRTAGYEDTLRGAGPFTVFAPTDEAFAQIRRSEMERLMQPRAHDELVRLISYHVVLGRLTTANLQGRVTHVRAASGYNMDIDARDGLRVNDQLVAMPDIDARNGVLQGINAVLSPPVLVAAAS